MMKMQHSTAQVADKFGTTTRTLRKFLRADAKVQGTETPGKGSRYTIEGKELKGLQSRFKKWQAAEAKARAEKAQKDAEAAEVEATESTESDNAPEGDEVPEPADD